MPQMSPFNWTFMFITFISLLSFMVMKLYFSSVPMKPLMVHPMHGASPKSNMFWKW